MSTGSRRFKTQAPQDRWRSVPEEIQTRASNPARTRALQRPIAIAVLTIFPIQIGSSAPSDPLAALIEGVKALGWTATGESRTFRADNLWEYINGDAERYVEAGVRSVRTVEFKYRGRLDAVVDIYLMSDPQGARRIFDSESVAETDAVQIGEEARIHDTEIVFRIESHFVRISAYEATTETREALLALGRALASLMTQA
jgi:hypothetical protein